MKKGRRIISVCMTVLVMLLAIAGCGKKESLVGKWTYTDEVTEATETMELFSDGTGILAADEISQSLEWAIVDGKLKIEVDTGIFGKVPMVVDYELDGDKLMLTNEGETITYMKE